jgi:hypothetical protein
VNLIDRYFLGANFPFISVRGFEYLGPRESNQPIGSDLHYTAGAHLTFPISSFKASADSAQPDWLKGHLFYNMGNAMLRFSQGDHDAQNEKFGFSLTQFLGESPSKLDSAETFQTKSFNTKKPKPKPTMSFKTVFALFVFALIAISQVFAEEVASRNNNERTAVTGATVIVSEGASSTPTIALIFLLGSLIHKFITKN